ncbi:MAG: C40 family peptidase [Micavibrio sp.]
MKDNMPSWVSGYIGIPFAEKGRDRDGCDCWGLVRLVLQDIYGVKDLPAYTETYSDTKDTENLPRVYETEAERDWIRIDADQELPGDVVLMRIRAVPMHVGVVIAKGWMIHVCEGIDSTRERYDGLEWRSRIIGYFRHKSLQD